MTFYSKKLNFQNYMTSYSKKLQYLEEKNNLILNIIRLLNNRDDNKTVKNLVVLFVISFFYNNSNLVIIKFNKGIANSPNLLYNTFGQID